MMIGTAASFHALPCVQGAQGASWLLCSSTQESEPDSHPLAVVTVTTLTDADSRPFCDQDTKNCPMVNAWHNAFQDGNMHQVVHIRLSEG